MLSRLISRKANKRQRTHTREGDGKGIKNSPQARRGTRIAERPAPKQQTEQQATNKHATSSERATGQSDLEAVPDDEALELKTLLSPAGLSGKPRGGPCVLPKSGPGLSKSEALDDIVRRLADGQTIPSQEALADDWERPKQTVSDWLREWRRIGIIPKSVQVGRCKAIIGALCNVRIAEKADLERRLEPVFLPDDSRVGTASKRGHQRIDS